MNTQKFKENGNNKFPVSTDTFDFMQEQILLASKLSALAGGYVIIKQSTASSDGLCIYNGELMPLKKSPDAYIVQRTETESITANGETFWNVRTIKYAEYVAAGGRPATSFWSLTNLQTLKSQLDAAAQHHVPTGAIMMWSGSIANIPTGWALCDGQNGTPNLQGRFIVGATTGIVMFDSVGYNYPVGTTGGKNKVALTVNQMPTHNHNTASSVADGSVTSDRQGAHRHTIESFLDKGGTGWRHNLECDTCNEDQQQITPSNSDMVVLSENGSHSHTIQLKARGGGQAHENRPVFYALAYIMKVI